MRRTEKQKERGRRVQEHVKALMEAKAREEAVKQAKEQALATREKKSRGKVIR